MKDFESFESGPVDLKTIRRISNQLGDLAGDDPGLAVKLADLILPRIKMPCAIAEILSARGSARRRLGDIESATEDLRRALQICSCPACLPRIQRRQAILLAAQRKYDEGLRKASAAVEGFRDLGETEWVGRSLAARSFVHWSAWFDSDRLDPDHLEGAISDARDAVELIPPADAHHFCAALQSLACYLTYANRQDDWAEALDRIEKAEYRLNKVSGGHFRALKLHLRWIKCLAQVQLNRSRNHRRILEQIAREMLGEGLPLPDGLVDEEIRGAQERARKAPGKIAGVVADLALLGTPRERLGRFAMKALDLQVKDSDLSRALQELISAIFRDLDLRPFALELRSQCQSAPALPPCLIGEY